MVWSRPKQALLQFVVSFCRAQAYGGWAFLWERSANLRLYSHARSSIQNNKANP